MSELPRRIVSRLRRYIGNRRRNKRAVVKLNCLLRLSDPRTNSNGRRQSTLGCHTLDLSTDGVALVVPAIRIDQHYLVGNERRLYVTVELPSESIELTVVAVRYESLDEHPTEQGYLIGARITEANEPDLARLAEFVNGHLVGQTGN